MSVFIFNTLLNCNLVRLYSRMLDFFPFINASYWRGQCTLFLCNYFYVKVIVLLNIRITLAVEVLYVHQVNDGLGVLEESKPWAEAPIDKVSSTCVLRSELAGQLILIVPIVLVSAQHVVHRNINGGRVIGSVKCLGESLTLRSKRKLSL